MRIARTIAAIAVLALLAGCATVAQQRKLERRISELEHGGGVARGDRLADLGAHVDALQGELERMNGRVEVAEHRADQALAEAHP